MTSSDWLQLIVALVLVIIAGVFAAAESALHSFSRSRAERLVEENRPGAKRVHQIMEDPPRYLNTALLVRTVFEICAIVLVAAVIFGEFSNDWPRILLTAGIMIVISYVWWGVAPRTIGRQHADGIAGAVAGPLVMITAVLGPIPKLLILIGNALTPGKGFREGPFSTEAELRELVDLAEASELIEKGEREMIHSVFELGDTIVKEVMVPRTDMVYIEDHKTLRQAMSLCLRSGFSRVPVIGDGLDDVVGVIYLKDVIRRVYDYPKSENTEKVSRLMRKPEWCPDSKPVDELLREMQLKRSHLVIVVDEFGGTAGMATIEDILEEIVGEITDEYDAENTDITELGEGRFRVSSRLPIDELGELFGQQLDDEDVETVGGLMAKVLNKVPIAGAVVKYSGLELVAERSTGRRNKIGTVVVGRAEDDSDEAEEDRTMTATRIAADSARAS
ncbi:hemolysin family protein [Microlunatus soli]|uniref:Hemolysin, contains CBS domains n=1 Tax=Microlunatus soli TaxID=630515 RepID=A0A1H1YSD8_9ACTN|nr:hemolysin family protein [Microlunatus soli]SDT24368.1 Hemolysin, contains CBS domains [Microlunatus soli]